MKIFGPIIKAVIVGGGSAGGVYGTYLVATELANTNDGTDLTTYWTNIANAIKDINLDQISLGLEAMGKPGMQTLLSDSNKTKEVMKMIQDKEKRNVVINVATGCTGGQKTSASCQNIGETLTFLSEKLKDNSTGTNTPSSKSYIAKWVNIENVSETLNKATPDKLIKYLDTTQMIEKSKNSLSDKTFGLSSGLFDAYEAFYTWSAFKNMNKTLPAQK